MKKLFLAVSLVISGFCYAQQPFTLKVKVSHSQSDKLLLYQDIGNNYKLMDSTIVKDGVFNFSGTLSQAGLFFLAFPKQNPILALFMDKGNVEAELDATNPQNKTVKGSVPNDEFAAFLKESDGGRNVEGAFNFVQRNPKSIVSLYMLQDFLINQLEVNDIKKLASQVDSSLYKTPYYGMLIKKMENIANLEVGKVAPSFKLTDINGKEVSLESFRGKFLVIDFWASWCGPCRGESPNMVKLYSDFKDKGLEILGVSLDNNKNAWLTAINTDKLLWTQVSDLQGWNSAAAKLYRVQSIPQTYFLDKNGVIIAKKLRGEELREAVTNALK